MKLPASPLQSARSAALLAALVAALVYANSLANGFAYDDNPIIVENELVHDLSELPAAVSQPYWPGRLGKEHGIWRPLTTATFSVLYTVGGGRAWPFHLTNVLAHAAVSALVVLVAATLMPIGPSLLAGILFAVHPVHVEAVANGVGLAEMLSAAAVLGACLLHLRAPSEARWAPALAVGGLYLLAFASKESGVVLPALLFLLDAARRRLAPGDLPAYLRERWPTYGVCAAVAALMLLGRIEVVGQIANPTGPPGEELLEAIPRIWTLGEIWLHYVRLWFFPLDLAADYAPNVLPISISWTPANVVGTALALAVLALTWAAWRSPDMAPERSTPKAAAFGVVWFIVAISPISNVLFTAGVLLAERTLYLPSVGCAVATGWVLHRWAQDRRRAAVTVAAGAVVLASMRTWTRTPAWEDNDAVFSTLIRDYPQSGRSQWVLGDLFFQTGDTAQAFVAYRAAARLLYSHYTFLTFVGGKLVEAGRWDAAERMMVLAWRYQPDRAFAPGMVAAIRAELGDPQGTERWARIALAVEDDDPVRRHLLAWALAAQGRWAEAEAERAQAGDEWLERMWHAWVYEAYQRRRRGDTAGTYAALDSAWALAKAPPGRPTLDAIRVSEFGLESRLEPRKDAEGTPPE